MSNILRHERGLNVSGKPIPNIGGGWNSSRYNENQFVKKSRCVGLVFRPQNGGHNKAFLIQHNITDSLTVSLHNPSCNAAKDIVKYSVKYNIIKLGYYVLNLQFIENKDFAFHESLLFEKNDDVILDIVKNTNKVIDRQYVMKYIKEAFLNTNKIDFNELTKAIKEL